MGHDILARLDRIPVWALPRHFLAIIGIGYFFVFYDIADIGYALPAITDEFGLTGSEGVFVAVAVGLVGYAVGSIGIGSLADRFGRYRMLILTMTLTAVGSFGDAAAQGLVSLAVFRFVTGMGVGADLNLVSTYVSELAPARVRGRITVLTFVIGILGQTVTPFVALALVPHFAHGWRLLFVIGGAIALLGLVARTVLPESPRWEVLHGRVSEAERTVARMEQTCAQCGVSLPDPAAESVDEGRAGWHGLFARPYGRRLAILISMWFLWYIGNYGFLGDATQLMTDKGAAIGGSILFLAIGAAGYPVGAAAMLVLVDRLERRVLILISTVVWLIGMLLVGSFAGDVAISAGAFLAAVALGSYLQVAYTFTAESFPTRGRATLFALSDGIGHSGGALGALALPVVVAHWSFFGGFAAIGVTGLLAGLVALLGPAATGRRLEHVSG
ncbi:MFS transporter [Mycolicibacterium moriokaense]|nr:MFS transporter [Mycolicibacterium moriokaense]